MKMQRTSSLIALVGLIVCSTSRAEARTERVITVDVAAIGRPIKATRGAGLTVHLLCDSETGPKYAKSTDGGKTFSAPIAVVTGGAQTEGLEYSAWDLAVGKGERVHVALSTNAWKLKLPEEEWGYFYAHLDPGASAFSPVRNINKKPSEGFSLAADAKGNVSACWLSDKLYANVSHDNGETFSANTELNPRFNPCNCCTTSAVYGEDGRLAVLYREETANERDMYVVLWDQAGGAIARRRVSRTPWNIDACPMTYYTIARNGPGYAAAWPTKGQIYFARLDADGNPSKPEETLTPGKSGMRTGVLPLSAPDRMLLVAWKSDGRLGWQLYGPDGQVIGSLGTAKSSGPGAAGVVDDSGRFILFR